MLASFPWLVLVHIDVAWLKCVFSVSLTRQLMTSMRAPLFVGLRGRRGGFFYANLPCHFSRLSQLLPDPLQGGRLCKSAASLTDTLFPPKTILQIKFPEEKERFPGNPGFAPV